MIKMKRLILLSLSLISLFSFSGCADNAPNNLSQKVTEEKTMYQKITAAEAKKIMDEETDYIILDVRTKEEFDEGHIESAVLIPDYEIKETAEKILTDKSRKLLVYCRSGRRSAVAAKKLVDMGYASVLDFGGIIDWPYKTVK
ncbi:MAG: rhodanese-like domain-containing protein [Oscillospiraceae bacterium]